MTSSEAPEYLRAVPNPPPHFDPAAEWTRRAEAHNHRAAILQARRDAEEAAQFEHDAAMAEARRRLERLQMDQALKVATWSRVEAPPGGPSPRPRARPAEPVADDELDDGGRHHQEPVRDLDAEARALFERMPNAGRGTVMRELGIDEGPAKTICARYRAGEL